MNFCSWFFSEGQYSIKEEKGMTEDESAEELMLWNCGVEEGS